MIITNQKSMCDEFYLNTLLDIRNIKRNEEFGKKMVGELIVALLFEHVFSLCC